MLSRIFVLWQLNPDSKRRSPERGFLPGIVSAIMLSFPLMWSMSMENCDMLYSHNYNDVYHNYDANTFTNVKYRQIQMQADSVVQVQTHLLISEFGP